MSENLSKDQATHKSGGQLSHQKAAEHHELAATHHKAAAKKLEMGDHERAAHHALIAQSYAGHAKEESKQACMHYVSAHEPKKSS